MNELLLAGLMGLLGGLARAFFGLLKQYRIDSKTKFIPSYLIVSIVGAGVIGIFVSLLLSTNQFLYLIAGYAGIDIIESLVKAYRKKSNLI